MTQIWHCVVAAALFFVGSSLQARPKSFELTVERNMTCQDGSTNGRLLVDDREVARTLEPAAGGNRIPTGAYEASIRADGNLGWRIELKNVPGWENVQIHVGNYPSNTRGCILVGTSVEAGSDPSTGQQTCKVGDSKQALENIRTAMATASDSGVSSEKLAIKIIVR